MTDNQTRIIPAMFCPYCGSGLPSGATACPACGRAAPAALTTAGETLLSGADDSVTYLGGHGESGSRTQMATLPPPSRGTAGGTLAGAVIPGSPLAPGTAFGSRYHIIRLLGVGGMGAVYQAWDDALGVAVALKVIRPEITADPGAARDLERRFKRELLLARQVTHKNVVRIHDLGEIDGIKYLTMPYIQGSDLSSVLAKEGKLPVRRVVAVMRQVVSGLAAAHEAGVVHRDLKPANIMIDADDQAVIMDFGIARSVSAGVTVAGAVVGTLEYMAPEQAMAQPVDHRADIYALGLILYDMVLGPRHASRAESAVAELMARVQRPLTPARTIDPSIPEALERIIDRCTQPDPAARYQTTAQLAQDLELLDASGRQVSGTGTLAAPPITRTQDAPVAAAPSARSVPLKTLIAAVGILAIVIGAWVMFRAMRSGGPAELATERPLALAVLPFRNATGDASLDWLGPSLAEMIGGDIGQSSRLRLVSSERVFQLLKDLRVGPQADMDPGTVRRISEFSSADRVVAGRFVRLGDQIRIEASLYGERGDPVVITASAAGENDLLRAAQEAASEIQKSLSLGNAGLRELRASAFRPSTQSVQAIRYYTEGLQRAREGEHLEAAKRFEEATRVDSQFALAYARLGQSLAYLRRSADAQVAAKQAADLSANLPMAERELIRGTYARITNDLPTAIASYERLLEARPMDTQLRFEFANLLDSRGELERARDEYAKVLEADPKYPDALFAAGRNAIRRRDYRGSLEWLSPAEVLAVQLDNKEAQARVLHALGVAYKNLGRLDDARKKYEDSLEIKRKIGDVGGIAASLNELAQIHDFQGRSEAVISTYQEAIESYRAIGDKRGVGLALSNFGAFYLDRGRYDEALAAFKEALPIQRELGDRERQALCLHNIGSTYAAKGDYQEATTYLERALELRESLAVPSATAEVLASLAEVSKLLGEYDRAQSHYLRTIELARGAGDRRLEALGSMGMGVLRGRQGQYGVALEAHRDALAKVRELKERSFLLVNALSGYGAALSQAGRFDEAAKHLEEALEVARELKSETLVSHTLNLQGDDAYYRGDARAARALYEQARQAGQRASSRYDIFRSNLNLAKLAAAEAPSTPAVAVLRKLRGEADELGLKYESAECSVYLGQALIGAKNASQARSELETAVSRGEKLGARILLIRGHHLLGEALRLAGDAQSASRHTASAQALLEELRKELRSDGVVARRDLPFDQAPAVR